MNSQDFRTGYGQRDLPPLRPYGERKEDWVGPPGRSRRCESNNTYDSMLDALMSELRGDSEAMEPRARHDDIHDRDEHAAERPRPVQRATVCTWFHARDHESRFLHYCVSLNCSG